MTAGVIQLGAYYQHLYPHQRQVLRGDLGLGGLLRDSTDPDDVLVVLGDDWAPMLPYAARRRALMFRTHTERDPALVTALLDNLAGETVGAFITKGRERAFTAVQREVRQRWGLVAEPVVTGDGYTVWTDAPHRERMIRAFGARPYSDVELTADAIRDYHRLVTPRQSFEGLDPDLRREVVKICRWIDVVESDYPVSVFDADGVICLSGHPSQVIELRAQPGRRVLDVEFGIVAAAIAGDMKTDGVGFEVRVRRPDGQTETRWRRVLRPANNPDDRGLQRHQMVVELQAGDVLITATDPGDGTDISFDWAYWRRIELN